ncbi:hypothetical protein LFL96_26035 [Paraburkholderia sp. D15]|uniref:hypothetical protein n=1 Tax=Paraburkholderia sp. D15 TaxID=2880218 RepID=UPI00247AE3BD|nr:hypothetical protein [Paraburkholderia sp. D15]WGS54477.1 hypothetical protein LFL96_26035 [Paraburkholderia sp. D15]
MDWLYQDLGPMTVQVTPIIEEITEQVALPVSVDAPKVEERYSLQDLQNKLLTNIGMTMELPRDFYTFSRIESQFLNRGEDYAVNERMNLLDELADPIQPEFVQVEKLAQKAMQDAHANDFLNAPPEQWHVLHERHDLEKEIFAYRAAEFDGLEHEISPKLQALYLNYQIHQEEIATQITVDPDAQIFINRVTENVMTQREEVAPTLPVAEPVVQEPAYVEKESDWAQVANKREADLAEYRQLTNPSLDDLNQAFEEGMFKDYLSDSRILNKDAFDYMSIVGIYDQGALMKGYANSQLSTMFDITTGQAIDYYMGIGGETKERHIQDRKHGDITGDLSDEEARHKAEEAVSIAYRSMTEAHGLQKNDFDTANGDWQLQEARQAVEKERFLVGYADRVANKIAPTEDLLDAYTQYSRVAHADRIRDIEKQYPDLNRESQSFVVNMKPATEGFSTMEEQKARHGRYRERYEAMQAQKQLQNAPVASSEAMKEVAPVQTAQKAPEKAPEVPAIEPDVRTEQTLTGTLLAHGAAPYKHDPKNSDSYFVTLKNNGQEVTRWGVDFAKAFQKEDLTEAVQLGDHVKLDKQGKEDVVLKDNSGQKVETYRNEWKVETTQSPEEKHKAFLAQQAQLIAQREAKIEQQRQQEQERDNQKLLSRVRASRPISEFINPHDKFMETMRQQVEARSQSVKRGQNFS